MEIENEIVETKKRKTNTVEYNANYYLKNKETILTKLMEKVNCPNCGRESCHQHLKRHMKSNLCQKRIEN
jgi:hypothetical protein